MIRARTTARRRVAVALLGMALIAACGDAAPPPSGRGPRIVSLLPAATEILFALGVGDEVVGRSRWCDWPPAARELPAVGDAVSVNAEKALALRPDLVLVGSAAQAEGLAALEDGTRIERVTAETVPDVERSIRRIGALVGREERAAALVMRIDAALAGARARAAERQERSVLFVVQREPLIVAGGGSYVDELLRAVGARNAAGDSTRAWPTLSLETLVRLDPDVILDADLTGEGEGRAAFWSAFGTLTAVRKGRVLPVAEESVLRPGPRIGEALAALEKRLGGIR